MDDAEIDQLLAEMRADLQKVIPALKERRLHLETWIKDIEKRPSMLFGWAPPLPGGGHASLLSKEEVECGKAVVKVLKKRLALVYRAMGVDHE